MKMQYYILGYEYNNTDNTPDFFMKVSNNGILVTTTNLKDARCFNDISGSEEMLFLLKQAYNDYNWFILIDKSI
jgi:hypothetical protein